MNTYNNTCVKSLEDITGKNYISSGLPMKKKQKMLARHLDPSRYEFVGFVDRSNDVVLRPRYHNVRDEYGRFAGIEA